MKLTTSLLLTAALAGAAAAQNIPLDQRFAYQGELRDAGVVVDGTADFTFVFFDHPTGGNQIGTTQTVTGVPVVAGVFTADVPFSDPFTFAGDKRFMEVAVRFPAGAGAYTPMNPRVELLPTPNAQYAEVAAQAFNANTVGGANLPSLVQKGEAAAVTAGMVAPQSITNTELAFATVTASKIATDIVPSLDGVTNDGGNIDLVEGPGIVISPDDNADTVTLSAQISGGQIIDGSITNGDLGVNSVDGGKIVDFSVGKNDLGTDSVDSSKIIDGSITASDLAGGALSNLDADLLDGLDSTQLLRADANAIHTGNLMIVQNDLSVGDAIGLGLSEGDSQLYFFEGGSTAGESLEWRDADDRFFFSDDLWVEGSLSSDSDLALNRNGPDGNSRIWFYDNGNEFDEAIEWDDGADRFELSDDLHVDGRLNVSTGLTTQLPYNKIGSTGTPGTSDISNSNDLFVGSDLEVGQVLYLNGNLYMDREGGDQTIWFHHNGFDQYFRWRSTGGPGFELSGTLDAHHLFVTDGVSFEKTGGGLEVFFWDDILDSFRTTDRLDVGGQLKANGLRIGTGSTFTDAQTIEFNSDTKIFYDGDTTGSPLKACASPINQTDRAMRFQLTSTSQGEGWSFERAGNPVFVIDADDGDIAADGSVGSLVGCDIAELFPGPADLEPGTVVAIGGATESVDATTSAYSSRAFGVVSTRPAFLMAGPTLGADDVYDRLEDARARWAADPESEGLKRLVEDLELAYAQWPRGEVPVALAGRVPVKVVGPVRVAEPLTSSDVHGQAMAMRRAGPSIGIAMEAKTSAGHGEVLMLVQPGWRTPAAVDEIEREDAAVATDDAGRDDLEARVAALEARGDARDGADGTSGRDGRPIIRIERQVWGDVDGDGRDDVLVLNPGGGLRLHRSLGDGRFEDSTDDARLGDASAIHDARLEDADGDGTLDLILVDADDRARVLAGNGAFGFTDVTHHVDVRATPGDPAAEIAALKQDVADLKALVEQLTRDR